MVKSNIRLSPIRLIAKGLIADSTIQEYDLLNARISFKEIFALVNHPDINSVINPSTENIIDILLRIRNGEILPPSHFESRFHILNHTGIFNAERGYVSVIKFDSEYDCINARTKIELLADMDYYFDQFDTANSREDFERIVLSGAWGSYFDACRTMTLQEISALTEEDYVYIINPDRSISKRIIPQIPDRRTYDLRIRTANVANAKNSPSFISRCYFDKLNARARPRKIG